MAWNRRRAQAVVSARRRDADVFTRVRLFRAVSVRLVGNRVLQMVAIARPRHGPRTRSYVERCTVTYRWRRLSREASEVEKVLSFASIDSAA